MVNSDFLTLDLTKESKKILKQVANALEKDAFYAILDAFFARESKWVAGQISKTQLSGQKLNRRSGNLARSVTGIGIRVRGIPAMRVGIFRQSAASVYAGPQELGTKGRNPSSPYPTIKPKRGKALAVPAQRIQTPSGVPKYAGPRSYPKELKFIPLNHAGKNKNVVGLLIEKASITEGEGLDGAKVAYFLLSHMDISPKYYLRDGFRSAMPELISRLSIFLQEQLDIILSNKK